jgi:hypothetical protein
MRSCRLKHHHPTTCLALFVEFVELVFERLLIRGRVPAREGEGDDVIHVEGVRHGDKVAALDRQNERLIMLASSR